MNHTTQHTNTLPIILRQTVILLFLRLALVELVFFVFFVTSFAFVMMLSRSVDPYSGLTAYILVYFALWGIKTVLSTGTILMWVKNYYELSPGLILYKSGILKRHSTSFQLHNISVQDIDQTFLGRTFHYGTIVLQNTFLQQLFVLTDIPNPQKCIRLIKECME